MSDDVKLVCKGAMLNNNKDISRLLVHTQAGRRGKEKEVEVVERQSKKAKSADYEVNHNKNGNSYFFPKRSSA